MIYNVIHFKCYPNVNATDVAMLLYANFFVLWYGFDWSVQQFSLINIVVIIWINNIITYQSLYLIQGIINMKWMIKYYWIYIKVVTSNIKWRFNISSVIRIPSDESIRWQSIETYCNLISKIMDWININWYQSGDANSTQ